MIERSGSGKPETFSEPRARRWRFGPAPRITIPASGAMSAARTGLTKVRTRSHVETIRNSLQTERHPQKKVGCQAHALRYIPCSCTWRFRAKALDTGEEDADPG